MAISTEFSYCACGYLRSCEPCALVSRAHTVGFCPGFSDLGVFDGARRGKEPCCPCTLGVHRDVGSGHGAAPQGARGYGNLHKCGLMGKVRCRSRQGEDGQKDDQSSNCVGLHTHTLLQGAGVERVNPGGSP